MSATSPDVYSILSPVSERSALVRKVVHDLCELSLEFDFNVASLELDALQQALALFRRTRPMRWRECIAREAGWAPTESDTWRFGTSAEFAALVGAGRSALRKGARGPTASPKLLFGTTLRLGIGEAPGAVCTAPVGFEWVDGPAADPLQLGLRIEFCPAQGLATLDLELVSGGWSEWAETWSTRDGSLEAAVSVVVPVRGRNVELSWALGKAVSQCADIDDLVRALGEADGLRAMMCISELSWRAEPPAWCPREIGVLCPRTICVEG